jgi:hypothetical protein
MPAFSLVRLSGPAGAVKGSLRQASPALDRAYGTRLTQLNPLVFQKRPFSTPRLGYLSNAMAGRIFGGRLSGTLPAFVQAIERCDALAGGGNKRRQRGPYRSPKKWQSPNSMANTPLSERASRLELILDLRTVTFELAMHPNVGLIVPNTPSVIGRAKIVTRGLDSTSSDSGRRGDQGKGPRTLRSRRSPPNTCPDLFAQRPTRTMSL